MCTVCEQFDKLNRRVTALEDQNGKYLRLFTQLETITPKPVYSVKEAAALVGMSAYTLSEWCRIGKFPSKRHGNGRYFITAASIKNFTENPNL